ncbi:MAG: carboxypeptidase regulatory-like domain-containing protein [Planctomycetota bacterium]
MPRSLALVALLVLAAVAGVVFLLGRDGGDEARRTVIERPDEAAAPAPPIADVRPTGTERAEIEPEAPPALPTEELAKRTFPARGVAVDAAGAPVAGLGVGCEADHERHARATTAADGSFEVELPRAVTRVVAADPGWTTLSAPDFRAGDERELRLVVARPADWSGWVLDATSGEPLHGAWVEVVLPPGVEGDVHRTTTDAEGRFELNGAAALPGARLWVRAVDYLDAAVEPPSSTARLPEVRLHPLAPPLVAGLVSRSDGTAAGGARVSLGTNEGTADADGRFELVVATPAPGEDLVAELAPDAPALLPGFGDRLLRDGVPAVPVELVLGTGGVAIEGRVLDGDGNPLKHWRVTAYRGGVAGKPTGAVARTRREGVFRIEGLAPDRYALRAAGRGERGVVVIPEVVAPASGVRLVHEEGETRSLAGVAYTADGAPAAGALVGFGLGWSDQVELSSPATTDAAGRFVLEGVPRAFGLVTGFVEGRKVFATVDAHQDGEVVLQPPPAQLFVFEAAAGEEVPDALHAVDGAGRIVPLTQPEIANEVRIARLHAGRSPSLAAPDAVVELVLHRGGREVARIPFRPDADGIVRLP